MTMRNASELSNTFPSFPSLPVLFPLTPIRKALTPRETPGARFLPLFAHCNLESRRVFRTTDVLLTPCVHRKRIGYADSLAVL